MEVLSEPMAEMHDLRFRSPVWKFWAQGIIPPLLSLVFPVPGLIAMITLDFQDGFILFALGAGAAWRCLFLFVRRIKTAMWQWGQSYPPEVRVDATGVHYLGARPVLVSWSDIEQVFLTFTAASGGKVYLRLKPDAPLLRGDMIKIRGRELNIGLLSQTGVMEEVAIDILEETAGPLLEIKEMAPRRARHAR